MRTNVFVRDSDSAFIRPSLMVDAAAHRPGFRLPTIPLTRDAEQKIDAAYREHEEYLKTAYLGDARRK
jgi:hypothetical protein